VIRPRWLAFISLVDCLIGKSRARGAVSWQIPGRTPRPKLIRDERHPDDCNAASDHLPFELLGGDDPAFMAQRHPVGIRSASDIIPRKRS